MKLVRKIALIGNHGVGKTSLISRYVSNEFSDRYLTTIGVKISKKSVALGDHSTLTLMIWDTEGGVRLTVFPKNYIAGSACGLFVIDGARRESWSRIQVLLEDFRALNPDAELLLAVNKIDLFEADAREAVMADARAEFREHFAHIMPTSAKESTNVEAAFDHFIRKMRLELKPAP